jgi:hypothetical protein
VYGLNQERAGIDYEPWRDFQRWLAAGNCEVVIPFAEKLARLIPPRSVRLRRDFTQILLAIKAHALLHRQHREVDERRQITATMDDYRSVHSLMNALIAESSGAGIRPGLQETTEAVTLATEGLPSTDGATAQAVGKILKLDKSTARRRLVAAAHEGLIVNLEIRRGQPGRYRVTGQKIEVEEVMPDPSTLPENKRHRTTGDSFESTNNDIAVARGFATGLPPALDQVDIAGRTGLGGTVAAVAEEVDPLVEFEERAAIREYDGGMPRAQAETMAATEVPELPDFLDRRLKRGAA